MEKEPHPPRSPGIARSSASGRWRVATALNGAFLIAVIAAANSDSRLVDTVASALPGADFTGHVVLIGLLAFAANGWADRPIAGGVLLRGSAAVALLALAEELSQIWLPARSFSASDLVADALGIALADAARRVLLGRLRARRGPADLAM